MKWLFIALTVAIVLLLILLVWQFFQRRFGVKIIRIRVGKADGHRYEVVVQELQSTKRSAEYVRILLGTAAAMLYWVDQKTDPAAAMRTQLLDQFEQLSNTQLTPQSPLTVDREDAIEALEVSELTGNQLLQATLHYENLAYRFVRTQGFKQKYAQQLWPIWLAILTVSLRKWDQQLVDRFQGSLRAMIAIYRGDPDYLTMQSVIHYPNRAFLQYMTGTDAGA